MIVYNLWQYLVAEFISTDYAGINYVTDAFEEDSKGEAVLLRESGGVPSPYDIRQEIAVQVICRSFEKPKAKKVCNAIYLALKNKFRVDLPAVTVDGEVYPLIKTAKIAPIQTPGHIGVDDNKHHLYSFNIVIVIGG